jgi:ABC-type lipoprotein release transport system permease subunit
MMIRFWFATALKFLVRSPKTSLALGLMIASAVGMLVFVAAMATGINDCMIRNSTGLFSGQISGTGLPVSVPPEALMVTGVRSVLKRWQEPGILTRGDRSTPLVLLGIDPEKERGETFLWKKIDQGRFLAAPDARDQILIGRSVADLLDAGIGDLVHFRSDTLSATLKVTGILQTGIDRYDRGIAFSGAGLMAGRTREWSAAIFLDPGVALETVTDAYARLGLMDSHLRTWEELMPDLKQLIDLNRISMGLVMVLVLGVVSFGIACAFTIVIINTLREYGIIKAMGVTPFEAGLLIFFQVVIMNAMATAAGTLTGTVCVMVAARTGIDLSAFTSHNQYFVVSGLILPRLTPPAVALPSILAFGFSLLAALWPAVTVIRQRTSEILRTI